MGIRKRLYAKLEIEKKNLKFKFFQSKFLAIFASRIQVVSQNAYPCGARSTSLLLCNCNLCVTAISSLPVVPVPVWNISINITFYSCLVKLFNMTRYAFIVTLKQIVNLKIWVSYYSTICFVCRRDFYSLGYMFVLLQIIQKMWYHASQYLKFLKMSSIAMEEYDLLEDPKYRR